MAQRQKKSVSARTERRELTAKLASRLNVIFHGPFIFVFYANRVEVMGADTKEHVVGAGTWTREKPCAPGTYYLTGINTPQSAMPPVAEKSHAIVDIKKVSIQVAQESYYKFVLDKPSFMDALGFVSPQKTLRSSAGTSLTSMCPINSEAPMSFLTKSVTAICRS